MHPTIPTLAQLLSGAFLVLSTATAPVHSQQFEVDDWALTGDARWNENRQVLAIDAGVATLETEPFVDGEVSFDVQLSGGRSFVYVRFRDGDGRNWEEIYLRGHKSNAPDGVQYTPVIEGASQWQLFHGEGGTAAAELPVGSWIPIRVQFVGRELRVFVGPGAEPTMVVARMTHEPIAGRVALRSFLPRGTSAAFGARFRRIRVSPGRPFEPAAGSQDPAGGVLRQWQVGRPFATSSKVVASLEELPEGARGSWRDAPSEPGGAVLLARLGSAETSSVEPFDAVVARHEIRSGGEDTRVLELGFSDAATVFLNGRPLVALDQSYRYDRPRVQGVLGFHQARVFLPLEEGRNVLEVVVTDSFGGWAVQGRWVE